jgi:hypothetical protein
MKALTPIQKSAKGEACTVLLSGCRIGNSTTVLAHKTSPVYPNSPRRCDHRACYTCVNCHDILDDRKPWKWMPFEKDAVWGKAIERTHVKLVEKGLMKIKGFEFVAKILPRQGFS